MKKYSSLLSAVFITLIIYLTFYFETPKYNPGKQIPLSEFSTKRALEHVAFLSQKPHYIGSENHTAVSDYLQNELQQLGLQSEIQEGYSLTEWGNLTKSRNIIAKINGSDSSKALLLLSHYDSAPHSKSHGAGDDASGMATILEGLRAFLHNKTLHKNDIIVVFSDAEEIGLNGAGLFVTQHKWAKDVGLAINFEARGSSGPAYMLMEVNKGNQALAQSFSDANVPFAVSNSLMYSIYKMLPNDTDLTVFREHGKIQGINFAFIDNHFNYHTQQDDYNHLDPGSIEHEGSSLMPLLHHYSNADLSSLDSEQDYIYFNMPFSFVVYPFSWIYPMLVIAIILFLGLVFIGFGKKILSGKEIAKGSVLFLSNMLTAGVLAFVLWRLILEIYPQYKDILHGFTYNGHSYIGFFLFFGLALSLLFYRKKNSEITIMNYTVAPLVLWIAINSALAVYLPGAGFFIIPVFAALICFGYFIITQKTNMLFYMLMSFPALIILVPFTILFPIGLGLKILFGSVVLLVLIFGLLLPVFGNFSKKATWSLVMFMISIGFFIHAHANSGYEYGKAKPNSLVYLLDADQNKAFWTTYDQKPDDWTKGYLGEHPANAASLNKNQLFSKYGSKFTFMAEAPLKEIPQPTVSFLRDTIIGQQRYLDIQITPNRKVNRYDIFAGEKMEFHNLKANGINHIAQKGSKFKRNGKKLLSYYVVDNAALRLQFSINKATVFDMEMMESSFDLLENPLFSMSKRADWMMPMPFVLNDAVSIVKKINPIKPIPNSEPIATSNENN